MRSLTGIVNQTPMLDDLEAIWGVTEAADEFHVLPRGRYSANAIEGELTVSRVKRNAWLSHHLRSGRR